MDRSGKRPGDEARMHGEGPAMRLWERTGPTLGRAIRALGRLPSVLIVLLNVLGLVGFFVRDRTLVLALLMYLPLFPIGVVTVGLGLLHRRSSAPRLRASLVLIGVVSALSSGSWMIGRGESRTSRPCRQGADSPALERPLGQLLETSRFPLAVDDPGDRPARSRHPGAERGPAAAANVSGFRASARAPVRHVGPGFRREVACLSPVRDRPVADPAGTPGVHRARRRRGAPGRPSGRTGPAHGGGRAEQDQPRPDPDAPRDRPAPVALAHAEGKPIDLVVGDFNAVSRSIGFDALEAAGDGYRLASRSHLGWRGTWPSPLPVPGHRSCLGPTRLDDRRLRALLQPRHRPPRTVCTA